MAGLTREWSERPAAQKQVVSEIIGGYSGEPVEVLWSLFFSSVMIHRADADEYFWVSLGGETLDLSTGEGDLIWAALQRTGKDRS